VRGWNIHVLVTWLAVTRTYKIRTTIMSTLPVAFLLIYDLCILLSALQQKQDRKETDAALVLLFFCSGVPALIYQIVWQRALFAIYGVNSESVTVVVSAFMIGLGLGCILGGWLSARFRRHGILLFALAELGTAAFGMVSLQIFHWAALHTAGASLGHVVLLSLSLLLVPTTCMGVTLPLLTDVMVQRYRPVGYSVGSLYFANTFGSAVASYACAAFLLRDFAQSGSVRIAALINLCVGLTAFLFSLLSGVQSLPSAGRAAEEERFFSLKTASVLSAAIAFVSLGFEIVWFRVFVIASESRASAFAHLLATFLAGIAAGSFLAGNLTNRKATAVALAMSVALLVAGGSSPVLLPLVAFLKWKGLNYLVACTGFFVTAALLGAAFPLLCRLGLSSYAKIGWGVSLIYLSNIAGSAFGSLFVGFVLMNHLGMRAVAATLGALTITIGLAVLCLVRRHVAFGFRPWAVFVGSVIAFLLAQTLYSDFQRKLRFGPAAAIAPPLAQLVENRTGTIAVLANGAVFGDSVYDGFFNVDPINDKNMIVRAYAVAAFHPSPRRMLMIGLSSGSWAQVLANHPASETIDIVEINPGYLALIRQYPIVSSLLRNPRVHIFIDDGRRWLLAHPERHYDLVVQNTSFYWRDHIAELLSADYLRIISRHLAPGGIYYYNTTGSDDALATGLSVFPYGLRVVNFLAVSDSPISVNQERLVSILRSYKIDGRLVFEPGQSEADAIIEKYRTLADSVGQAQIPYGMEDAPSMRRRIKNPLIFTDDNMGWEWR
jgi:spermidine synthase